MRLHPESYGRARGWLIRLRSGVDNEVLSANILSVMHRFLKEANAEETTKVHRKSERARRRPILLPGTQSMLLLRPLGPSFWFRSLMKLIVQPPLYTGTCCVNGDRRFLTHRQLSARRGAWTSCVCAIESSVLAHNMNQRTECPPHRRIRHPISQRSKKLQNMTLDLTKDLC
jgi:hypothetical protein